MGAGGRLGVLHHLLGFCRLEVGLRPASSSPSWVGLLLLLLADDATEDAEFTDVSEEAAGKAADGTPLLTLSRSFSRSRSRVFG